MPDTKMILALGLTVLLAGCSASRNLPPESLRADGRLFGEVSATDTASMAQVPWNEIFSDASLQRLIREGLANNPDLQIAVQQVTEAEAYFQQSGAALFPNLSLGGYGTYNRNSESIYPNGPRESKTFRFGLESNWEVDVWGKLRSSKRASYATLLATDAGRKAVQTRLIANIANAYYTLLALDAQLAITEQTVRNYISLVETMKVLNASGKVTGAAVVQSEATRYSAEITIPDLRQRILETENILNELTGRPGGSPIERGNLENQPPAPAMRVGIPAMLLDNRPDVMQSRYQVLQAFETRNSARAAFYPSFTISASSGLASIDLDDLFDPASFAAQLLGGLTQPLFDRKANRTRLRVAAARQEEALLNFKATLLTAGNEVQNALALFKTSESKIQLRKQQMDALEKSVEYTNELLTYGSANYTEVLIAQQSLLSARLNGINDHVQQLTSVVSLYRALGGGWEK